MLKNFLYGFIIINILITIFANFTLYSNFSLSENNSDELENDITSYFIPNNNKLFWPTPRLS